jgi:tRNA G18 (ribose-2'-O)-methylase SpoU
MIKYNVHDSLQRMDNDKVKEISIKMSLPAALILFNVDGGINISMAIRSAALFGFSDVYIVGKRKRDKRGDVGACNYIKVHQLETINNEYFIEHSLMPIIIEQNGQPLEEMDFKPYFPKTNCKVAFIVGSEQEGVPKYLKINIPIITISQYGVMRSFNVAMASSIVMYEYTRQWRKSILNKI